MFNVTGGEVLLVGLVALLVLGPKRLPQAARTAGRLIGQVRAVSEGFQREVRDALAVDATVPATAPTPAAAGSADAPPRLDLDDVAGVDVVPPTGEPDAR